METIDNRSHKEKTEIRISCRLELLPGDGVLSKFSHARDFGFDAIALPGRYLDSCIDDLRKESACLPLPISSVSLGFKGSLVSSSPASRQMCHDSLVSLFDLCAELAVPTVNMPPGLAEDNGAELADSAIWEDLLVAQLPALADEAGMRGVTLLIEPVNRSESIDLHTLASAVAVCRRVQHPCLGMTADLYHMQKEESGITGAIRAAGSWIKCFHVASDTRQEPGVGSMDFAPAFDALKEIGYNGFLEVESRTLSGSPETCLPRSVEFLRRVWEDAL